MVFHSFQASDGLMLVYDMYCVCGTESAKKFHALTFCHLFYVVRGFHVGHYPSLPAL